MKRILVIAAVVGAAFMTACGNQSPIQKGSLSGDMDTLSYAFGVNVAEGFEMGMKDIPMDWKKVEQTMVETALDKTSLEHKASLEKLQAFFGQTLMERRQAVAKKRAEADSVRLAEGDTTKVEWPVADPEIFASEEERAEISQALGNDLGKQLVQMKLPVQLVWLVQAMQETREGNGKLTSVQARERIQNYFMVELPAKNLEASEAWLKQMASKRGAQTTESGIVYKIVKAGDEAVKATSPEDVVKVHYTGRLRTGEVFDSSIFENLPEAVQEQRKMYMGEDAAKSEPAEFPLNRVIPGWTEGMQLVGKGGKILLWIPAKLAYGERGAGGMIGPNEALEFEVELIDVNPQEQPAEEVEADAEAAEEAPAEEVAE